MSSRIVVVEHITLDGVIQAPARADEDPRDGFPYGRWSVAGNDPRMQEAIGPHLAGGWSLLLGRVSYEDLAGHWPNAPRPNPFSDGSVTSGRVQIPHGHEHVAEGRRSRTGPTG